MWGMDTTTIILLAVIVVGLVLIAVLRMRRSHDTSSSQAAMISGVHVPDDVLSEVRSFLDAGDKIRAIQRVHEVTHCGLRAAKNYVDALTHNPTPSSFPAAPAVPNPDVDIQQIALRFLSKGQKLEAIKRVREVTGWGLREAKDYVEAVEGGSVPPRSSWPTSAGIVPEGLRDEVLTLLSDKRKIEAVKLVRAHTYWGLKEAKDYVDAIQAGSVPQAPFRIAPADSLPEDVRSMALDLVGNGRKIEAIKLVREATRWGLKEAKDYVEAMESGADRFDL